MRASASAEPSARPRPVLALAFALLLGPGLGLAQTPPSSLEPRFRLPIAGRPTAPLLLDSSLGPSAAWALSEDHALYLLSEEGVLLSRIVLPSRPRAFLALDGAGRALVILEGEGGPVLSVWTRMGREAFRLSLADLGLGESSVPSLALGADDRLFLGAGKRLLCIAQNGQRLWSHDLPSALACGPSVDGLGRPVLGLADGRVIVLSPYGEIEAGFEAQGPVLALSAFVPGSWRGSGGVAVPDRPVLGLATTGGELIFLDRKGWLLSRQRPQDGVAALASEGSVLYSLSSSGLLMAWSPAASLLWKAATGVVSGSIDIYGGRIVVTGRGKAVSLSRQGEVLREASFANAVGAPIPTSSGLLFSPGADWVIGAYPFERALGPRLGPPLEAYGYEEGEIEDLLLYDPAIGDSGHRLGLLADLAARLDSGELGAGEGRAVALASAMARGDFDQSYPAAEARFRVDPLPRARALEILGRLGSPSSLGLLVSVFSRAQDPSLRAAACDAIGAIARDPRGEAGLAFSRAITAARSGLDGQVASGIVAAIEVLALRSGSPPGLETLRALLALTQGNQRPDVKNAATRALSRIAGSLGP